MAASRALAAAFAAAAATAAVTRIAVREDPAIEPWAYLNNGGFTGPPVPLSPDPLVSFQWTAAVNSTPLQCYDVLPVAAVLMPNTSASAFAGLASFMTPTPSVTVSGPGGVMIDFGTESAAWIEIDSADLLPTDLLLLSLAFSEWAEPLKIKTPVAYNGTYRLETNAQLYEGVRFGFIMMSAAPSQPFTISAVRAVAQAKPVNYVGAFSAAGDDLLTRIWYTAAYTVRLNLEENYFGAILVDRGDRISWTGDAHVAQAASMAAFGNFAFVLQNLNRSATDCNGIESYCIYWVLSVLDLWRHAGGDALLLSYVDNVGAKLEHAHDKFEDFSLGLTFFGWDDRTGSGFADASTYEAQVDYRFLVLRAWSEWAAAMAAVGRADLAAHFAGYATAGAAYLRQALPVGNGSTWYASLGVHAASEAVNAPGFATPADVADIAATTLNDAVTVCSLSNFNQYWILQALGNAGALDRAVESIHRCWGVEVALGATAFWEVSHPDWALFLRAGSPVPFGLNGATSLCHPWSAGPAPWLSKFVLGVTPTEPGYRTVAIVPHLTAAMAAAGGLEGAVPTPHGPVTVSVTAASVVQVTVPTGCAGGAELRLSEVLLRRLGWLRVGDDLRSNGGLQVQVQVTSAAPKTGDSRTVALVVLPADEAAGPTLEDGSGRRSGIARVHLPAGAAHAVSCTSCASRRPLLQPRQQPFAFAAAAISIGDAAPFPPPSWPGRLVETDSWTQGSWLGRYGAEGYSLFSFGGLGTNVTALPGWVTAISTLGTTDNVWTDPPPASDPRALQDPTGNASAPRQIGCVYSSFDSFGLDVHLAPAADGNGSWYQFAAYVVDYDFGVSSHEGLPLRRATVAALDLHSLNPVAPVQYVPNAVGGVWLVFQYTASLRLRFSQLHGDNAVVSAIAFDAVADGD